MSFRARIGAKIVLSAALLTSGASFAQTYDGIWTMNASGDFALFLRQSGSMLLFTANQFSTGEWDAFVGPFTSPTTVTFSTLYSSGCMYEGTVSFHSATTGTATITQAAGADCAIPQGTVTAISKLL